MTRIKTWILGTAGLTAVAVGIVWIWTDRIGIAIHGHALVAMIIGLTTMCGLAIALMNLMYWSNRRGTDDSVHHPAARREDSDTPDAR